MSAATHAEWCRHLRELGILSEDHRACPQSEECAAQRPKEARR